LNGQLSSGSEERFVTLADRQLRPAFRLAGYLLGDASEAEEAVQDAIERAWKGWPRLRDEAQFGPWFDRILVNVCRDRGRRRGRLQPVEITDDLAIVPVDPFRRLLDRDEIGRALVALSADQRAVVVLRYWRDLSLEEISEYLDLPLGTVKSRLHYGLQAMRGAVTFAAVAEVSR
jgi:RNA polymerase sigma-70 factor (ECF subfamily)